ncbi:hypothetical protein [Lentzea sp. NEAU-D7]|uniref:hypothetical protein n=1 Tax=Lentzea sp. NEAU-D7 TaxID=2994667 RepID=UPI00224A72E3|nr:hypothetical protein [Lentzea sp. NEAU-D7]MCX2951385.1 hypothetical protein [Lentzea sp. NEAU-D7]
MARDSLAFARAAAGYHPCSINSTTAWTATTPVSFFAFPLMANLDMLAARKDLIPFVRLDEFFTKNFA